MKIYVLVLFLALTACATDDGPRERFGNSVDTSQISKADGEAYVTDAMSVDKWEPVHPATDDPFYFKTCSQVDEKSFYSMTSYECTTP